MQNCVRSVRGLYPDCSIAKAYRRVSTLHRPPSGHLENTASSSSSIFGWVSDTANECLSSCYQAMTVLFSHRVNILSGWQYVRPYNVVCAFRWGPRQCGVRAKICACLIPSYNCCMQTCQTGRRRRFPEKRRVPGWSNISCAREGKQTKYVNLWIRNTLETVQKWMSDVTCYQILWLRWKYCPPTICVCLNATSVHS
jgi:hypothetical protein